MRLDKGKKVSGEKGKTVKIKGKLAQGGFGIVFRGVDEEGERCVVKQANIWDENGNISDRKGIIEKKLKIEKEILGRVGSHARIPTLLDYDEEDSPPYLVTDFINGHTFYDELSDGDEYEPLSEDRAKKYIVDLLNIIEYLHRMSKPVVHRDIKPGNIMVHNDEPDKVSLIDFGSSVAGWEGLDVKGGTRIFTAGYGAPEQERGKKEVDVRTDIYGVGTTLFFLLTGKNLRYDNECFNSPYHIEPPSKFNPEISRETDEVVLRATKLFPEDRYHSAREMKMALKGETVKRPSKPMLQLGGIGHTLDIKPNEAIKIGRRKGLKGAEKRKDIHIDSKYVSDLHAKLIRNSEGYWIKDMYSLNGTAVYVAEDGRWIKLKRGQEWRLYSEDKIALGYNERNGACIELLFRNPEQKDSED